MSAPHQPRGTFLTVWETATGVREATQEGLVPGRASASLSLLLALVGAVLMYPAQGLVGVLAGLVFGRLMALDLTTYTLPNIYTLPLLAMGVAHAATHGLLTQTVLACLMLLSVFWLSNQLGNRIGMGAGDLKLMAALFGFIPAPEALFGMGLGATLWLPVAFFFPRRAVPFGVPVLLGWVLVLSFPGLPNWFFSTIP